MADQAIETSDVAGVTEAIKEGAPAAITQAAPPVAKAKAKRIRKPRAKHTVAPKAAAPMRRGMLYIGDGIRHYPGVPADPDKPLTWEETRSYFGESYEARRKIVEQEGAIYDWDPPKAPGDGEDE